jgi:hypothetical protein
MGHKGEDTAQYYVSGFVGIDSQSMLHGREQRLDLYNESSSMMAHRNLLIPKPLGATLIKTSSTEHILANILEDLEENNVEMVKTRPLSAKQEYEIRRQSRNKEYQKNRQQFIEGTSELETASTKTPTSEATLRKPSRYLQALLKFEPDRQNANDLMFCNQIPDTGLLLSTILEPLTRLANPQRKRYAYKTAEPTEDNRCHDCTKNLTK